MAVLLVLSTFLVFIVIDFFMSRSKKVVDTASAPEQRPAPVPLLSSASIEGILVPDQLRFHAGHTWLLEERENLARVGADALAIRVIGAADKVELPKVGRWVRQGQRAFTFHAGVEKIDLVSPAEGEVSEINHAVLKDPSLAVKDPYGNGWLVKVKVPERDTVERNLLPRSLVRVWMKEEIRRVRAAVPQVAQVAVMGGGVVDTVTHDQNWRSMTHDVFLN